MGTNKYTKGSFIYKMKALLDHDPSLIGKPFYYPSYTETGLDVSFMNKNVCVINYGKLAAGPCCYVKFKSFYAEIARKLAMAKNIYITAGDQFRFMEPDEVINFIEDVVKQKENKMNENEFTLETTLFGKLKENNIYYRFINGVYNPEKIVIKTKTNHDICTVRSIPYSEGSDNAYEVNWLNVPSYILANLKITRVKQYVTSGVLIKDILSVEREFEPIIMKLDIRTTVAPRDEIVRPYIEADVLATEALYKYREYGIVDVIFNDPATIIIWADGTKTVVKAENEKFDPEKGLAMAISKKVLGNKHDYYEVFKKYVGRYEKKQAKKIKKTKKEK